jgi:transposase
MKRKKLSKEFKAKVAVEALKGQRTVNELAQEFGVHVSQSNRWKKELLESAPEVFGQNKERESKRKEMENDQLYQHNDIRSELFWQLNSFKSAGGLGTDIEAIFAI